MLPGAVDLGIQVGAGFAIMTQPEDFLKLAENWIQGSTFDGHQLKTGASTVVCFINCVNENSAGLWSFHPGSAGIALDDGSARMISENISLTTFCRLVSYVGHTPVPDQF